MVLSPPVVQSFGGKDKVTGERAPVCPSRIFTLLKIDARTEKKQPFWAKIQVYRLDFRSFCFGLYVP